MGFDLHGKTVGVIGTGKIGSIFARIMAEVTVRAVHAQDPFFADRNRGDLFNRYFDLVVVQKSVRAGNRLSAALLNSGEFPNLVIRMVKVGEDTGALADTLTSFSGLLPGANGQTPVTAFLDAGATASYGTVEEPCNPPQKFSRASVLIDHYWRGATALEAYWRAVQWPGQGLFVGEPLAQPFRDAPRFAIVNGEYQIQTRQLRPGSRYTLEYLQGSSWTALASFTGVRGQPLDGRAPLPPAAATQIRWVGPCPDNAANRCTLAQSP